MKVSLLKLRNESKDYFQAHEQVNSFFWGDFLRIYSEQQIRHSVVVASPMRAANISRKSVQVQLLVTYASRVFSDFSNLDEVHSDALDVLSDFVDAVNYAPRWTGFVIGVSSGNAEIFTQRTGDLVAGAAMIITLTIKNTVDLCAQPVSDYDFS